eukprot:PhM_4_TR15859/c0_g1_i1/m.80920
MNGGWDLRYKDLRGAINNHTQSVTAENAELLALVQYSRDVSKRIRSVHATIKQNHQQQQQQQRDNSSSSSSSSSASLPPPLVVPLEELESLTQAVHNIKLRLDELRRHHQWPFNAMLHDFIKLHHSDIEFEQRNSLGRIAALEKVLPNCTPEISAKYEDALAVRDELRATKRGFFAINDLYMARNEQVVRNERFVEVIVLTVEDALNAAEKALNKTYEYVHR